MNKNSIGIWDGGTTFSQHPQRFNHTAEHKARAKQLVRINTLKTLIREKRAFINGMRAPQERHEELIARTRRDIEELVAELAAVRGQ